MKSIRNLCLIGALAVVAACDPYTDEFKGQPKVLEVFAAGGNSGDGVLATVPAASGDGTVESPWDITSTSVCSPAVADDPATAVDETLPQMVKADAGLIFIKMNKLLDGASIQATPESCEPAGGWLTVTRDGSPDDAAKWFSCYYPSSPTSSEGASIVLYRGAKITGGPSGSGAIDQANDAGSTAAVVNYVLSGEVKDKQGNPIVMNVAFHVEPDAGPVGDVTVDTTAKTITWEGAQCVTGADSAATGGYVLYKQDPADEDPVKLADIPAGTVTFLDDAMTADRAYFIAPVIADVGGAPYETAQQGPFDTSTNPE